jgi:hypothetical protein
MYTSRSTGWEILVFIGQHFTIRSCKNLRSVHAKSQEPRTFRPYLGGDLECTHQDLQPGKFWFSYANILRSVHANFYALFMQNLTNHKHSDPTQGVIWNLHNKIYKMVLLWILYR